MPGPTKNSARLAADFAAAIPTGVGSALVVHLDRVVENLRRLRVVAGSRAVWAVVKADGYGVGAVAVSRALVAAGVHGLAVARIEEALQLRANGVTAPILILGPVPLHIPDDRDIEYTAGSPPDLSRLVEHGGVRVHVKVDTGMTRLGFDDQDLRQWLPLARALGDRWVGLCTHWAQADVPDSTYHRHQIERFVACLRAVAADGPLPPQIHAANSAGVATLGAQETAFRPGLYLYGANPWSVPTGIPPPLPVVEWVTRIVSVREIVAGTSVSYRSLYTATDRESLAVIPIGYADGLVAQPPSAPRLWTAGGDIRVRGRITMDACLAGGTAVRTGEIACLVGPIDVDGAPTTAELAACCGRIPYEATTSIGPRVARLYRQ